MTDNRVEIIISAIDQASSSLNGIAAGIDAIGVSSRALDQLRGATDEPISLEYTNSLQRIAEFAAGHIVAEGIEEISRVIKNLAQNAVESAMDMQMLTAQLTGLVTQDMARGVKGVEELTEAGITAYKNAHDKMSDLDINFANKKRSLQDDLDNDLRTMAENLNLDLQRLEEDRANAIQNINDKLAGYREDLAQDEIKINQNLSDALSEIAKDTADKLADIQEKHASRIAEINQSLNDLEANYSYDKTEREEDLQRSLTRMEEDYNDKRAALIQDLEEATTDTKKKSVQERIDLLDHEYNKDRARRIEDANEREQDALDTFNKQKDLLQRRIDAENEVVKKQTEELNKQNDERVQSTNDRFAAELQSAKDRYSEEVKDAQVSIDDINAKYDLRSARMQEDDKIQVERRKERYKLELDAAIARYDAEVEKVKQTLQEIEAEYGPEKPVTVPVNVEEVNWGDVNQKVESLKDWVKELSLKGFYSTEQITEILKQNMAMGATIEQSKKLTEAELNLFAIRNLTGAQLLSVKTNMAQALIAGDLYGMNMRQLNMQGIGLADVLENQLGMSLTDIRKDLQSGKLTTEDLINAFVKWTETVPGMSDANERLGNTLQGTINHFQSLAFWAGGETLQPALLETTKLLKGLFDRVLELYESGALKEVGQGLGDIGRELNNLLISLGIIKPDKFKDDLADLYPNETAQQIRDIMTDIKELGKTISKFLDEHGEQMLTIAEYLLKIGLTYIFIQLLKEKLEATTKPLQDFWWWIGKIGVAIGLLLLFGTPAQIASLTGLATAIISIGSAIVGLAISALPYLAIFLVAIGAGAGIALTIVTGLIIGIIIFRKAWDNNWLAIKDIVVICVNVITSAIITLGAALKKFFAGDIAGAWDEVKKLPKLIEAANEAYNNAKKGLDESLGEGAIKSVFANTIEGIKDGVAQINSILGNSSPSKLFAGIGSNMMRGLALGIDRNAFRPALAMQNATRQTTNQYYLTANYGYQSPVTLAQDVRLLQMMTGEA